MTSMGEGKLPCFPIDRAGVAIFYNKTIFDKYGLSVPATYEDLVATAKKLKDAGFAAPIAASDVSMWVRGTLDDLAYRQIEDQFLVSLGVGDFFWTLPEQMC